MQAKPPLNPSFWNLVSVFPLASLSSFVKNKSTPSLLGMEAINNVKVAGRCFQCLGIAGEGAEGDKKPFGYAGAGLPAMLGLGCRLAARFSSPARSLFSFSLLNSKGTKLGLLGSK